MRIANALRRGLVLSSEATILWDLSCIDEHVELYNGTIMCSLLQCIMEMSEYVSNQKLVIHQWAGPSVVAQLAPNSTPDRAE